MPAHGTLATYVYELFGKKNISVYGHWRTATYITSDIATYF
jgi:hypothetical protein